MPNEPQINEGKIPFKIPGVKEECHTYYKTAGDIKSATPLIMLHGGPGAGHEDQFHLAVPLALAGIPTIYYDEIGCARSSRVLEKADDMYFWGFDLFCAELDNLIDFFGLRDGHGYYIHGQSWGGMLASTFAERCPRGLRKLVIANSKAGAAVSAKEYSRQFRALGYGDEFFEMDRNDDFLNPVYLAAGEHWSKGTFCLRDPLPAVLTENAHWEDATNRGLT
ncbi:hypothetical protein MRB53_039451 [Persea americana]|nr:hypothetical protein MRB53_039451 [Persea americana]